MKEMRAFLDSAKNKNRKIHFTAACAIFNGLKDLGFVKGNTEEAVHAGAHALFFPCGTGHLMGLDVHDMENLGEQYVWAMPENPKARCLV